MDPSQLFFPSQAIRKQRSFLSGRRDVIKLAVRHLTTPGTSLLIYGQRGIGKTTVGWQTLDLLLGNKDLLGIWKEKALDVTGQYKCAWIQCHKHLGTIENSILYSFARLRGSGSFFDEFPEVYEEFEVERTAKEKFKLDLRLFAYESEKSAKLSIESASDTSRKLIEESEERTSSVRLLLHDVVARLHQKFPDHEVVIFIDEVDLLERLNPDENEIRGPGTLIKEFDHAKFVFIGIGRSASDLIKGHKSVQRKLRYLEVGRLSEDESGWILQRAEGAARGRLIFTNEARTILLEASNGSPFVLQRLGLDAVWISLDSSPSLDSITVDAEHARMCITQYVRGEALLDDYSNLVSILKSQEDRKIEILKRIAEASSQTMSVRTLMSKIKDSSVRWLPKNVDSMVEDGILYRDAKDSVSFTDPVMRLIVLYQEGLDVE